MSKGLITSLSLGRKCSLDLWHHYLPDLAGFWDYRTDSVAPELGACLTQNFRSLSKPGLLSGAGAFPRCCGAGAGDISRHRLKS